MSEFNLDAIVGAVRQNCHISDAQFAGDLTLCTYLLKMRELYRWERAIPLSSEMPKGEVGDWMNARAEVWDGMENAPYAPIPLGGEAVDPFDSRRINAVLSRRGYVYSGGYGRHCKPHFFLAELLRSESRDGYTLHVCGRELARDLDAPPGMYQDRTLFVRTEALRRWLWEKYEEWSWSRKNEAMRRALTCYPFADDPERALDAMTACEMEAVILHELGEARVGEALGEAAWQGLLADVMRGRAEIMARAVRDLCADCLSTLPGLAARGEAAAIHFYFANFTGMRRKLAPQLYAAYTSWLETGDTTALRAAAAAGLSQWRELADEFLALHRQLGADVGPAIEAKLAPGLATPT